MLEREVKGPHPNLKGASISKAAKPNRSNAMSQEFFPTHVAVQIYLLLGMTALAFAAVLTTGTAAAGCRPKSLAPTRWTLTPILAVWFLVIFGLAYVGWLRVDKAMLPFLPNLPLVILLPVLLGVALLASPRFAALLDAVPVAWFAGHHVLRIFFGFVFLSLYEMGAIPAAFAFRGGYGDIISGALGGLAAYLSLARFPQTATRAALWVFTVVGLLDFALVLYTGLSTITPDLPFVDFYPFILIPGYAVPMFILTHIYAVRALLRGRTG
jgi:phage shock protein PspC (stress-responsive transcriptional regulator)